MIAFIDEQRDKHGVEPICKQLPIAVSTYYEHKARQSDPDREPERIKRDRWLKVEIQRVWDENLQVYGAKKVWHQLKREGIAVARCTVERLMNALGIVYRKNNHPVIQKSTVIVQLLTATHPIPMTNSL